MKTIEKIVSGIYLVTDTMLIIILIAAIIPMVFYFAGKLCEKIDRTTDNLKELINTPTVEIKGKKVKLTQKRLLTNNFTK